MTTKQKIFDHVVTNLLKQGQKALAGSGACCYQTSDGLKCAGGWLFPDDLEYEEVCVVDGEPINTLLYWPDNPNSALAESVKRVAKKIVEHIEKTFGEIDEEAIEVAGDLQRIHDECDDVSEWRNCFFALADEYGLDTTVLRNAS